MNCCNGNNNENGNKNNGHKGHMPHMLMMLLCCGAPILLLLVLPLLQRAGLGVGGSSFLSGLSVLICPIMMMGMMFMMMKSQKREEK